MSIVREEYRRRAKSFYIIFSTATIFLIITFIISLKIGIIDIKFNYILDWILIKLGLNNKSIIKTNIFEIINLRFVRTLTAFIVGMMLSVSGVLLQASSRNSLADPFILGLSSGALTLLSAAMFLNPVLIYLKPIAIMIAFIGALIGLISTLTLFELTGGTSTSLILSGIAVSATFGGIALVFSYMVYAKYEIPITLYILGSVSMTTENDMVTMLVTLLIGLIFIIPLSKPLNAILYGDEYAKQLGYNPKNIIRYSSILASFLTGVSVAFTGIIGFIGLIVPHISRFLVGNDHRYVIPISILIGGLIVCYSDLAIRYISLTSIGEIPIGALTSVIGGPFLAYLTIRSLKA